LLVRFARPRIGLPCYQMSIISWNVRGLGNPLKRKKIKVEVRQREPDVLMLQETKVEVVDGLLIRSVWDSRHKDWSYLPSVGASGGILVVWDSRVATCLDVIRGSFSLSVFLDFKDRGKAWISAVYGPNSPSERGPFWEELFALGGLCSPVWCLGGDFNVIRTPTEKNGGSRITRSMREFNSFIAECCLRDIPLVNGSFTWSGPGPRFVSTRIDRFLFTTGWEDLFPNLSQEILRKPVSDHFPIALTSSKMKWGPTPFRFENMWLSHPGFLDLIQSWWDGYVVQGWKVTRLWSSLLSLKRT
jgi:hypothetical protein